MASDSGSEIIDEKQSRMLPAVPVSSASEISVANQCHDLKLPCPIKILRSTKNNEKRRTKMTKVCRMHSLSVTQKTRPTLRKLHNFTEGLSLPEPENNFPTLTQNK